MILSFAYISGFIGHNFFCNLLFSPIQIILHVFFSLLTTVPLCKQKDCCFSLVSFFVVSMFCLTEMAVTVFIFLQVCTRSWVALGCLPQNVITGS